MTLIELAKPAIDIGLMTNQLEASQAFWGETVGLKFDHLAKVGGGVHQHRYDCNGSVLKLNHSRKPLETAPSGYAGLRIASPNVAAPQALETPDGLAVELVPPGHDGVTGVEVLWRTADRARATWFLETALGAAPEGERFRLGTSLIALEEDPAQPETGERSRLGFRYITVQIRDLNRVHPALLELGVSEGLAPVRLGDTAYISFVRDPDGNWIEMSQRASLTGPLPDVPSGRLGA